jgi:outer membrane protein assembly factor BamB
MNKRFDRRSFSRKLILWLFFLAWGTSFSPAEEGSENWPRLRGPFATGLPADTGNPNLPDTWSRTENIAWKVDVPGVGWSSPVVWENKVFITTVTNDKESENARPQAGLYLGPGRKEIPSGEHEWLVYCFDLVTGNEIWKRSARKGTPPVGRHPKSCYAAETPVTDGERLYVLFGDVGLFCYDLEGELLWTYEIEPKKTQADYGAAASPVMHGDQVFYVYDNQEASYIAALDTRTGKENWRVPRIEKSTWATPFVWETEDRTEIVVCGKQKILSYDLEGKVIWGLKGYMSNLVIPSPFVADGLLYIASGYVGDMHRPAFAIKPGATGDMALEKGKPLPEAIEWYLPKGGPYNTTPLVYDGLYYLLLDRGMLAVYDARTGQMKYDRTRFPPPASFTSSPWAYNGRVFCLGEDGKTFVVKAGPEFELLHVNDLGPDLCLACPAIVGDRLLIRTQQTLWCVAKPQLHPGSLQKN